MKLVVVDDTPVNRKLLRVMLEAEGHTTLEAGDGIEALQILGREKVDAVVSDILMPRMDGYRLCHEIRANENLRGLPIVIYSATYTAPSDQMLALDLGADKYLKKPSSAATILATVHEAILMKHNLPQPNALQQVEVLKAYSDRLVAKLEEKNIELEDRLQQLLAADAELHAASQELERSNAALQVKVAELSKSDGEKSVLLQEVHHRVNNNLQIMASLLRIQAESFAEGETAAALRASQLRIESMAQFYDSNDLREVDFGEYADRLAENLFQSYGVDRDQIAWSVKITALTLGVDQAIPAGLILSELISNAVQYAFPGQRRGTIRVEGGERGSRVELVVTDDGVGMAEPLQQNRPPQQFSSGLRIVSILSRQLRGTLQQTRGSREPGPGTVFRISFPARARKADCAPEGCPP